MIRRTKLSMKKKKLGTNVPSSRKESENATYVPIKSPPIIQIH
jgi:hypothetical protein